MHKYTGRTQGGTLLTIQTAVPMKKTELRFMFQWHVYEKKKEKAPHQGLKEPKNAPKGKKGN